MGPWVSKQARIDCWNCVKARLTSPCTRSGIISLRDLGLTAAPDDLFEPAPSTASGYAASATSTASTSGTTATAAGSAAPGLTGARVADLSHNRLHRLPASLARLSCLHTLRLDANGLTSGTMPWEALGSLTGLTVRQGVGGGGDASGLRCTAARVQDHLAGSPGRRSGKAGRLRAGLRSAFVHASAVGVCDIEGPCTMVNSLAGTCSDHTGGRAP